MSYKLSISFNRLLHFAYLVKKAIPIRMAKLSSDIATGRLHDNINSKCRSHARSGNKCPTENCHTVG